MAGSLVDSSILTDARRKDAEAAVTSLMDEFGRRMASFAQPTAVPQWEPARGDEPPSPSTAPTTTSEPAAFGSAVPTLASLLAGSGLERFMPGYQESPSGTPSAMPTTSAGATSSGAAARINPSSRAARFAPLIEQVSREEGVPADVLAAIIDTEDSGETSVSPAGARGIMQVVPGQGFDRPGEDASDPLTSIRQGARALREKYRMAGNDWNEAGAAYFGYGTDALGNTTSAYRDLYQANRARHQQPTAGERTPVPAEETPAAQQQAAFAAGSWTPNQYQQAKAEGLDDETAWAVCGPAAAIAFARRTGRNPTMREALDLAQQVGWTKQAGMAGTASQQQLLTRMGIASKLEAGTPDWQRVAADVQAGNPVIIDAGDHYMVAERYDPETGAFDFGQSASVLRMAGGRRWFRPDELPGLSSQQLRISPEAAIYLDNPASPTPSVTAGRSAPTASPQQQAAPSGPRMTIVNAETGQRTTIPQGDPDGFLRPIAPGVPSPWKIEGDARQSSMNAAAPAASSPPAPWASVDASPSAGAQDTPLMLRQPLGAATAGPDTFETGSPAPDLSTMPADPDQGPRELPPPDLTYDPRAYDEGRREGGAYQAPVGGQDDPGTQTTTPAIPPSPYAPGQPESMMPASDRFATSEPTVTGQVIEGARRVGGQIMQPAFAEPVTAPVRAFVGRQAEAAARGAVRSQEDNYLAQIEDPTAGPQGPIADFVRQARTLGYTVVSGALPAAVVEEMWREAGLPSIKAGDVEISGGIFLIPQALSGGMPGEMASVAAGPASRVAQAAASRIPNVAGAIERAPGAAVGAAGRALRSGAETVGEAARGLGSRIGEGLAANAEKVVAADARMAREGSTVAPGVFGFSPEPARPARSVTVEVLEDALDATRVAIQQARDAGDVAAERAAVDRAWEIESALVDARNARQRLEPAIESDVGRRIERTPPMEETLDDAMSAQFPQERVRPEDAAALGGPVGVPTYPGARLNATAGVSPGRASGLLDAATRDIGSALGTSTFGAAAGAALPADSDEERRQNALIGAGAGLVAGPAARRLLGRGRGAMATFGFSPTPEAPTRAIAVGADPSRRYELRYRVVDLGDLIPSNLPNGAPNPRFPQALQPRDRGRVGSQMQIDQIARGLEPDVLLTDVGRLDAGPMIVGPDLVVESGNGRTLALQRAAAEYPERFRAYVGALRAGLSDYGLSPADLRGKRMPVLVRERVSDVDRAAFAAEANNAGLLRMSSFEQAAQDAGNLTDEMVTALQVGENDTIATALRRTDNRPLIRQWVGALPTNEQAGVLDESGNLSAQGYERLTNALLVRTYGEGAGERLARAFIESADPTVRNVQNALMASLPDVARAEALVRSGQRDAGLSIGEDMATAVEMLARLRREGVKVSDYLGQASMFERELTPFQEELLAFVDANTRSPRGIREALEQYAARVESTADPNQMGMFGDAIAPPTREELWSGAVRESAARTPDAGPLFASNPSASRIPADGAGLEGRSAAAAERATAVPEIPPARPAPASPRAVAQSSVRPGRLPDEIIPRTGGPAGDLAVEGAPVRIPRPGPVASDVLPRTGGPEGALAVEGAPARLQPARLAPVGEGALPTGGPVASLLDPRWAPVKARAQRAAPNDPDEADRIVGAFQGLMASGAGPREVAQFWNKVERGEITGADLIALYRRFNMLSGPRTIEVNALSGATNMAYDVLSQGVGQVSRGRLSEAVAEVAAPIKASGRAFQNLVETLVHGVSAEQAARGDIPRTLSSRTDNRLARGALTVLETPDRFNAAVDQFFRTMTEDWAATILAHQQARAAGVTPSKLEWEREVADRVLKIKADPSKSPELKRMVDRVTFSEEPGAIGKGLEAFRQKAPLVANLLFPFIRTPYNIASRAVDMSPLGIVRNAAEVATNRGRGRAGLGNRLRDTAIGTAATLWAYDQARQGNITGAGPDDPEKLAMLRATGWQPYSVKIGDQYWSYANFAPFSLALSMGAAAAEAPKYAKDGKTDTLSILGDGAARTAKVVTDMTVLAGLGAVVKSIQDPDRYGAQWLTQYLQTLIPAGSALNTIGQATDPSIRRAERDTFGNQVGGSLLARLPGLRQGVPAAQDPLGRPVPNEQTGIGALNPFRPTTERPDPAIQPFIDAGVDIGKPKETISLSSGAPPIPLTPAEQRRWNELRGQQLAQSVPSVNDSAGYARADRTGRGLVLRRLLENAGNVADRQMIAEIGAAEVRRRLTEAVQKSKAG